MNNFFNFIVDDIFSVKAHQVTTEEENVILSIIAPGHKKENFGIELKGDKIHISTPEDTKRIFKIPSSLSKSDISAEYDAGILKIKFGKQEEETRKIAIT